MFINFEVTHLFYTIGPVDAPPSGNYILSNATGLFRMRV